MTKDLSDNILINRLSITVLIFRIAMLTIIATYFNIGGFDPMEFQVLLSATMPISVLYLAAFFRFAAKFPYTSGKLSVTKMYSATNWVLVTALHLATISIIVYNAYNKLSLPFDRLIWILIVIESINAIYIAYNLTRLFEIRE